MGSTGSSWMLTYSTTRPVKVLYFDGESATLMGAGRMDAQMLMLFGNVTGPEKDGHEGYVLLHLSSLFFFPTSRTGNSEIP